MWEAIAFLVVFGLILDTRSRAGRLDHRLNLLEEAVRTRLRQTPGDPLWKPAPVADDPEPKPAPPAPQPLEVPVAVIHAPEPELVIEPEPGPAPVPPAPLPEPAKPVPASVAPAAAKPSFSVNFEDLFGRRLPIWAGGITLAIAGVLIVKYAIAAGFFTPWIQAASGFLFGTGLIAGAEFASRNEDRVRDPRVRQALSGAGIATLYATILMAHIGYGLIGPLAAFAGMALVTAGALSLSVRFGPPSALLGLAGGLATPALVGSMQPDVPMLSVYLALTIGGLTAVSRTQRWAWLGISALVGGAGWSLWLIATGALDAISSLSVGALVLLLAIGLPLFGFAGPRATLIRLLTALVGAGQLAMLVAVGGFTPLNWGLFGLIAIAGQWLSQREPGFGIVPSIGLALSALLLCLWPQPDAWWFVVIGTAMALIHGAPLMLRLWQTPPRIQSAIELAALSLAIPAVPAFPFFHLDGSHDHLFGLLATIGALVAAGGAGLGWARADRRADTRFALLVTVSAFLLSCMTGFLAATWLLPLGIGLVAAGALAVGALAEDRRIEPVAAVFGLFALTLLLVTGPADNNEALRLAGIGPDPFDPHALLRWSGLLVLGLLFAVRSKGLLIRATSQALATGLAYGAIAQAAPDTLLPLLPAAGLVGLSAMIRTRPWQRFAPATAVMGALVAAWAAGPMAVWSRDALVSLAGRPMEIDSVYLAIPTILKQLLIPALLMLGALWHGRACLPAALRIAGAAAIALLGLVSGHSLYRIGFAQAAGGDFVATGVAERVIWAGLLIAGGWALGRGAARGAVRFGASVALLGAGTLHALYYSLILHNPLWAEQAVGAFPVANLLIPVFALVPLGLWLLARMLPDLVARAEPAVQTLKMVLVTLFAYATLRQAFAGTLLVAPGLADAEDILRSILAISLATGFLLWGIRSRQRNWRIASLVLMLAAVAKVFLRDASGLEGLMRIGSFVALGFSLIGIGWLYSRQLRAEPAGPDAS